MIVCWQRFKHPFPDFRVIVELDIGERVHDRCILAAWYAMPGNIRCCVQTYDRDPVLLGAWFTARRISANNNDMKAL